MFVQQILTYSPLFNLRCRDPKDRENLDHYLNDYIHHVRSRRQFCIDLETTEKHLNPLKDVDESVLARSSILSCLRGVDVRTAHEATKTDTNRKEDADPCKYRIRGRKYLPNEYEYKRADLNKFMC